MHQFVAMDTANMWKMVVFLEAHYQNSLFNHFFHNFPLTVEDLERNDGSQQKPYYMSKNLMKILNKSNKAAKKGKAKDWKGFLPKTENLSHRFPFTIFIP